MLSGRLHGSKFDHTICRHVNHCGPRSNVLAQMIRVDLVQCIVGSVVQVEIPGGLPGSVRNHHWFEQRQGLPVNAAFEADNIISGIPEIYPAKITELRIRGYFEVKLHIVMQ